jgi:hypothetical protein
MHFIKQHLIKEHSIVNYKQFNFNGKNQIDHNQELKTNSVLFH